MTLVQALAVVAASLFILALLGGGGGLLVGSMAPDAVTAPFYTYPATAGREFNGVQIGFGLGLIFGALAGLVVGIAVTALVTWYEVMRQKYARGDIR